MSWGKKDERLSKMLYENGLFLDKRSRVVYDPEMNPHLKLKGDDWKPQRDKVFKRDKHTCQVCGKSLFWSDFAYPLEVDHIIPRGKGGSDDLENLQTICAECHRTGPNAKHVQVQLKPVLAAALDLVLSFNAWPDKGE